ncbi:AbiV family abortive infection protein [Paenibacillus sp. PK1-4R]|uniref:AbiV family abortive infection protein n=1 Tax=Paenibacillus sp. PK1-4R TaxID=3049075 RepID=UPI0025A1BFEA|nr:AbiV family abortive infection protein [Paenibacillus sp. PK1-4R]WJM05881.1 AbiV family abortive infection protein [Paenibacillus sp. PK1-4R]
MNLNQLKVEEIEHIFIKIYENACELLEESEILYTHHKYARAYLCAHYSLEEFGKLPMLYSAALNVHNGEKNDWKKLNKRIRDHKNKISQSFGTIMFLESVLKKYNDISQNDTSTNHETNDHNWLFLFKEFIEKELVINPYEFQEYSKELDVREEYKIKYSMTLLLYEYKNGSSYADFDEGIFRKPSEKIDKETCEYGISLVYMQKKFIESVNFHKNGLFLYRYTDEFKERLKVLIDKYK